MGDIAVTSKNRTTLIIVLLVFLAAFFLLAAMFRGYTENYAIAEAEKLVQDALLTHRAVHKYINTVSRPELYRLKSEGKLYQEYFSPKTMSFTYTARGIKQFLNEERKKAGLDEIYFKLATSNPRNEINRTDEKEAELLRRMNEGDLEEFKEVTVGEDGEPMLYLAMATKPVTHGCLKCHGKPEDAPGEMVSQYPDAAGYYEKVGDIRALISIRVPLAGYLEHGRRIAYSLTLVTAIVLTSIYTLIWLFIRHQNKQQQIILEKNQALESLSVTDYLCGIYNRMGFMRFAQKAYETAVRYDKPLSLIMFDLDHFKQVNDLHGHQMGDRVLRELGLAVGNRLRGTDIFGRFGGEEFIIALIEQHASGAQALAEVLRQSVAEMEFDNGLKVTSSFGVAQLDAESGLEELIKHADQALYLAKERGRNQVVLYQG